MKVLIVEDDAVINYRFVKVLREIWPEATQITNADIASAVITLAQNNIDILIFGNSIGESEELQNIVQFIVLETRVIVFSKSKKSKKKEEILFKAGVDVFFVNDLSEETIKEGLNLLFIIE